MPTISWTRFIRHAKCWRPIRKWDNFVRSLPQVNTEVFPSGITLFISSLFLTASKSPGYCMAHEITALYCNDRILFHSRQICLPRPCSISRAWGRNGRNCCIAWSCTPSPTCSSFFPAIIRTLPTSARSTNWKKASCKASAAWSRTSICARRRPAAVLGVLIRSGTDYLRALWFNQPFMREKFAFGQQVMLSGKPKYEGLIWQMHHPRVETLADDEDEPAGKILPVYPLTEGLQQWQMRKIVRAALRDLRGTARRGLSRRISRSPQPLAAQAGVAADPFSRRPGESRPRAAAVRVSGAVHAAIGLGRQAAAAARPAPLAGAGGHGEDRRPHPPPVPLRADRRAAAGDRRDRPPTWPARCR